MATVKKVWITKFPGGNRSDLCTLSVATSPKPEEGIGIRDITFPADTMENRTVSIGLFDESDLVEIRNAIDNYLIHL